MDNKIKISIGMLAVLSFFYFYDRNTQNQYHDSFVNLFDFNHQNINKINILKNQDGIEIEKVDSIWKINGHDSLTIKTQSIDKFFSETMKVKRSSMSISEKPKDLKIYSLDDSSAVVLIVYDKSGNTLGKGMFGINVKNYFSNYYKDFENNKIYKTDLNILSFLTVNSRYWGEVPTVGVSDSTNIKLPLNSANQ